MKGLLARLSPRERMLAGIVGGAVLLLFNYLFISYWLKTQARLRSEIATRGATIASMQTLVANRETWVQRDEWLQEKQPKLTNESGAGVMLLDQVKELAKNNEVLLENPSFPPAENAKYYRSVPISVETKSTWPALIAFLRTLQQPEQFIVVENANIHLEASDPSQFRGKFKISKWYAP
ncbi:MAG: type II secretion system protein M [Verrucomicrobiota bacterium]|nr:type II secretion system protein M [Verrucomicrobiota bacterium]